MARLSSLFVRRPAPPPPEPASVEAERAAAATPPPVPPPSAMRRERRGLLRRRELGIRDLGGLLLEMVRRDRFRPELLYERADRVIAIEHRVNELGSLLVSSAAAGRSLHRVPRCACGAPLPPGVHFCSHCGRPARATPPVSVCEHCGQPLPADANFCAFCGNAVVTDFPTGDLGSTIAEAPAPHEERA
jgi:Double zinc ribbon